MSTHRACMRDHVRDAIVERILDGTCPPGTRLKEMSLARELNVSQAPVREALRELEALGVVDSERYRGTHVRKIDIKELREAYELRAAIEEASARRATPCAKEDLDLLEAELAAISDPGCAAEPSRYMNHVLDFNRHIVRMSGNGLFLRAWEHMAWDIRARFAAQQIGGHIGPFLEERRQIVDALRAGDGTRAGKLMHAIIDALLLHLDNVPRTELAKSA